MNISYLPGLMLYVAIEGDVVVDADTNRDALIERVGEPTSSSSPA